MIIGFHARNGDIGDHEDNGDVIAIGGTGGCGAERVGEKLSTVINSYQQPLAACQKKAEGKRELPPCTPYREKGRGKKDRRGILMFPSNAPARTRTRARMRTREALLLLDARR